MLRMDLDKDCGSLPTQQSRLFQGAKEGKPFATGDLEIPTVRCWRMAKPMRRMLQNMKTRKSVDVGFSVERP